MDVCWEKPSRKSAKPKPVPGTDCCCGEASPVAEPVKRKVPRALAALVTSTKRRRKSPPQVTPCLPRVRVMESEMVNVWLVRKEGARSCKLLKLGERFKTGKP